MLPKFQLPRVLRFGTFEVDVPAGELRKHGMKVKLQEQPFQLLCILVEHPGEVVTREELRSRLWPADTFVDFDHGLNAAIKRLRDALGESAETPIFVQTLARRGYRFIGNVEIPGAPPSAGPMVGEWLFTKRNAFLFGLAACIFALLFLYYGHSLRSKAGEPTVIPAVTNRGDKYSPSLSPDGQQLAFTWNGGTGPHFSIYVKLIGAEESLRLTKPGIHRFQSGLVARRPLYCILSYSKRGNRHLHHPRNRWRRAQSARGSLGGTGLRRCLVVGRPLVVVARREIARVF
jgi:DNA-binding winged helix-turn-helix (wHTH) protein